MQERSLEGFDPLSTIGDETHISKLVQDSQKRDILNILRSYTGTLDVFSESIQNAIDALEAKSRDGAAGFNPNIWITIDLRSNILRFVDNGIGMSFNEMQFFVRPSITFEKDGS